MRKITHSAAETKKIAEELAQKVIQKKPGKKALVLALSGDLGAGKTTFTKGFMKGLGIKSRILSPTFIIFRHHKIPHHENASTIHHSLATSHFSSVFHMDAYRIKNNAELAPLGFKEILNNPQNILLVEWPENINKSLPKNTRWIILKHGAKNNERVINY